MTVTNKNKTAGNKVFAKARQTEGIEQLCYYQLLCVYSADGFQSRAFANTRTVSSKPPRHNSRNTLKIKKILLFLIILFNSGVFMLYGTAKLTGFQFVYHAPPHDKLLQDVRPLSIMWYFFSLKKGYAVLVALAEIIPAILILFKRTRFLGNLLYLVTVTNIVAINIFFVITPWTLAISIALLINAIIILFSERQKIKILLS